MLNELQQIIADLYPSEQDARRLVQDARIPAVFVDFGGEAINRSRSIVVQAEKRDRLVDLVEAARREYPENMTLVQMLGALRWNQRDNENHELDAGMYRTDYRRKSQDEINEEIYTMIRQNSVLLAKLSSDVSSLKVYLVIVSVVVIGIMFSLRYIPG